MAPKVKRSIESMPFGASTGIENGQLIDGLTDGAGSVLRPQKSGNIDRIVIPWRTITGNPVFTVEAVSIDANGMPDGPILGAGTSIVGHSPTASGVVILSMTNPVTVGTGGQLVGPGKPFGLRITPTTADGSNSGDVLVGFNTNQPMSAPYACSKTAGTWTKETDRPCISALYDDDELVLGCHPAESMNVQLTFSYNSTPNEYATLFDCLEGHTVGAIYLNGAPGSSAAEADFTICLYEGTTLVRSISQKAIELATISNVFGTLLPLNEPYDLVAGNSYRVSVKKSAGETTAFRLNHHDFASANAILREGVFGEPRMSTRKDSGAWTDDATQMVTIFPFVTKYDPPAGGGAVAAPALGKLGVQ